MILDFHVHSRHSLDSLNTPAKIIRTAKERGLTGLAITDHGTIAGGLEVGRANDDPDFTVIIGSEIRTDVGDITGLFLTEEIRARQSGDVIEQIHAQGGLAVLPHPYKSHKLNDELIQQVDLIEVFNGRTTMANNEKALALARGHGKPMIVGSDAHFLREIGTCRVEIGGTDIRGALLSGRVEFHTVQSSPSLGRVSQIIKAARAHHYYRLPRAIAALVLHPLLRRR